MIVRRSARSAICASVLLVAATAHAVERAPVAVLWVGDAADDARALPLVEGVNQALGKSPVARPIDTANLLNVQIGKMPSTEVEQQLRAAREHFGALRTADAARAYEAAERVALEALPLAALQKYFPEIERGLLAESSIMMRSLRFAAIVLEAPATARTTTIERISDTVSASSVKAVPKARLRRTSATALCTC